MAKKPDDIYKKEELPLFAQQGYRRKRKESKSAAPKPEAKKENPSSVYSSQDGRRERKEGDELFKIRLRGSSRKRHSAQHQRIRKIIWTTVISLASVYAIVLISVVATRLIQQRQVKQTHLKKQSEIIEKVVVEKAAEEKAIAESILPQINSLIGNSKASKATLNNLTTSALQGKVDLEEEIRRLENTMSKVPQELTVMKELAKRYLSSDNPARGIPIALTLCQAQPRLMEHKVLLGRTLLKSEDFPASLKVGQWILEVDPFSVDANGLMANAYLQMNKLEKAIQHLHKVVDIDSRNIVAQNNLGVAYTRVGQFDRASRIFEGILLQDAASSVTYFNLASCHAKAGLPKQSIQVLQRATNHFGKNFIAAWIEGPTFEEVRNHSNFSQLQLNIPSVQLTESSEKPVLKEEPKPASGPSGNSNTPLLPSGR